MIELTQLLYVEDEVIQDSIESRCYKQCVVTFAPWKCFLAFATPDQALNETLGGKMCTTILYLSVLESSLPSSLGVGTSCFCKWMAIFSFEFGVIFFFLIPNVPKIAMPV